MRTTNKRLAAQLLQSKNKIQVTEKVLFHPCSKVMVSFSSSYPFWRETARAFMQLGYPSTYLLCLLKFLPREGLLPPLQGRILPPYVQKLYMISLPLL